MSYLGRYKQHTLLVYLHSPALVRRIACGFVVQYCVPHDVYIEFSRNSDELSKLFSRAPFGAPGPFLIEFACIQLAAAYDCVAIQRGYLGPTSRSNRIHYPEGRLPYSLVEPISS